MLKIIIGLMLLTIAALAAILVVKDDPGFLLLKYGDYSLETSLAFGIVAVAGAMLVIYIVFKIIAAIWHLPRSVKRQSRNRRYEKSRKLLNRGLIDLAEGRFAQAEVNLLKLVEFSENPLLHYLAAARAAQRQGKHDARDAYLTAAHDARPEAEIAIGVSQAELQLAHQQNEQSLATLMHLRSIAPRHDYILNLLARVYAELEDWQALTDLLPELRKKNLLNGRKLEMIENKTYKGVMSAAVSSGEQSALDAIWDKIPRALQNESDLIIHYAGLNTQFGWRSPTVESLIVKSLDLNWNDELIEIYGQLTSNNAPAQLKQAEKWLNDYGQNEYLLLALGRICVNAKLWGKAQGYLEASIGVQIMSSSCFVLAELYKDHLQQQEKSCEYYQKGLELSLALPVHDSAQKLLPQ